MRPPSAIKNLKVSCYADIASITSVYLAFCSPADSGKQKAKGFKWAPASDCELYKTLMITGRSECDVTFSNHLISRQTAGASSTSMTLPVPRKTSRVKAHVRLTQCHARRHKMKLDTGAPVCRGVNDTSSDRMREEEFVFLFIITGFNLRHGAPVQYADKQWQLGELC